MLSFRSSTLSCVRTAARAADERRELDLAWRGPRVTTIPGFDEARLAAGGSPVGTAAGLKAGGGSGFGALPMPLGSLTELLRPPALPGPFGMPLTPASCAKDCTGAIRLPANARAINADLSNIDHLRKVINEPEGSPFLLVACQGFAPHPNRLLLHVRDQGSRQRTGLARPASFPDETILETILLGDETILVPRRNPPETDAGAISP
jgi:hypothetical protein